MKKKFTRVLSLVFAVVMLLSSTAFAANKKPTASTSNYIQTYALNSSGKIYGYKDEALKNKSSNWIWAGSDECRIIAISSNGRAIKLSYPLDKGGRSTAWFSRSDFTAFNLTQNYNYQTFYQQVTTYRRSDGKNSYGYIARNDSVYILGTKGSYTQLIYPISNGKWKMAWAKTADVNTATKQDNNFWQWPVSGYNVTQGFGARTGAAPSGRPYHAGMDLTGKNASNPPIYAAASGTIKYRGYTSGNGNHVIIQHTFNGQTVYSLYSHLKDFSGCPNAGKSISRGQKIGTMGNTGRSFGTHLHFAIFTGKYSSDPYGYTTVNNTTKMTYAGITFYNPAKVIGAKKLP